MNAPILRHGPFHAPASFTIADARIVRAGPPPESPRLELLAARNEAASLRHELVDAQERLDAQALLLKDYGDKIRDYQDRLKRRPVTSGAMLLAAWAGAFAAVFVMRWAGM